MSFSQQIRLSKTCKAKGLQRNSHVPVYQGSGVLYGAVFFPRVCQQFVLITSHSDDFSTVQVIFDDAATNKKNKWAKTHNDAYLKFYLVPARNEIQLSYWASAEAIPRALLAMPWDSHIQKPSKYPKLLSFSTQTSLQKRTGHSCAFCPSSVPHTSIHLAVFIVVRTCCAWIFLQPRTGDFLFFVDTIFFIKR